LAPQGLQGLQGFFAAQGLQGLHGFFAAQGLQGLHGFFALQGLQGLHGFFAAQGLQGFLAVILLPLSADLPKTGVVSANAAATLQTIAKTSMNFAHRALRTLFILSSCTRVIWPIIPACGATAKMATRFVAITAKSAIRTRSEITGPPPEIARN
jgi:hypothetical protein